MRPQEPRLPEGAELGSSAARREALLVAKAGTMRSRPEQHSSAPRGSSAASKAATPDPLQQPHQPRSHPVSRREREQQRAS